MRDRDAPDRPALDSLGSLAGTAKKSPLTKPIDESDIRQPSKAEPCLLVRASGEIEDLRYFSILIEPDQIESQWELRSFDGDRSVWHGAPVLSEIDGDLIGVMLVGESGSRISAKSSKFCRNSNFAGFQAIGWSP